MRQRCPQSFPPGKTKVLLCACIKIMLTDKNNYVFRLHSFLALVGAGLYSASCLPGFPFCHISVSSGNSSHFIVAHLFIS